MRTVTLQSVIDGAAVRLGLDVTQTMLAHTLAAIVEYVNSRLREAQERAVWPEFVRTERRQYRADWAVVTHYVPGDEVYYPATGFYYRAVDLGTGNLPTDTDFWEESPSDFLRSIDFSQVGETAIGEVLGVYGADPRLRRGAPEFEYFLEEDSVVVPLGVARPWVVFCVRPTVYTTADVAADFPHVFAEFCKYGAAADMQREDGQFDKAGAFEGLASAALDRELDKIELKQGQQRRFAALTR
jgi:hypothetical protein